MGDEPPVRRIRGWAHDLYFWGPASSWSGEGGSDGMVAMLAARGAEGWELAAVTEGVPGHFSFFFKRPAEG